MAVIIISEELIEEKPELFEAIKEHYTKFKEIMPYTVATRAFEVQKEGLPIDGTILSPIVKVINNKYVIVDEDIN